MADTNELAGFIHTLRTWPQRPEIVGLVRLAAWPGGTASADTFAWLHDELLTALSSALPVDAVLLALHGALAAEGVPDVEGQLLEAVRALTGSAVPVVATLDLHANVTERMVRNADALVLYHTAPHVDVFESEQRGAAALRRLLDGARPVTTFQKLPLVVPAERANTQDPASVSHAFRQRLKAWEREPGILAAGLATVQPWLDIPELGTSVVVVTDGDAELAERRCQELADDVWRRRDYLPDLVSVTEGVQAVLAAEDGLVVLSDSADATTSGAPGEINHILRESLRHRWPGPALVTLVDRGLIEEAQQRGTAFTAELGGQRDRRFSAPLTAEVRVANLFDARFTLSGHLARNLPINMGPSAVLRAVGSGEDRGGVRVDVTSRSGPHFAPALFEAAGLDPFAAQVLVAKSPCGFRAAYEGRARQILVVRAPGCAPADFWHYPYRHIPRPLSPWDEMDDTEPVWPILVHRHLEAIREDLP
jgi:microcystin degradation protein MlrC